MIVGFEYPFRGIVNGLFQRRVACLYGLFVWFQMPYKVFIRQLAIDGNRRVITGRVFVNFKKRPKGLDTRLIPHISPCSDIGHSEHILGQCPAGALSVHSIAFVIRCACGILGLVKLNQSLSPANVEDLAKRFIGYIVLGSVRVWIIKPGKEIILPVNKEHSLTVDFSLLCLGFVDVGNIRYRRNSIIPRYIRGRVIENYKLRDEFSCFIQDDMTRSCLLPMWGYIVSRLKRGFSSWEFSDLLLESHHSPNEEIRAISNPHLVCYLYFQVIEFRRNGKFDPDLN